MCTCLSWNNNDFYFGRNLDLEYDFGQQVVITPRNYPLSFKKLPTINNHFALFGIATIIDDYPLYAEAINEKGLAIASLNFPNNAFYNPHTIDSKLNIAPYELIPFILAKCQTVNQAKDILLNTNLINLPFKDNLPIATLHWIVSDKSSSIVFEVTSDGPKVFDNPTGVLTNNPTFDYQLSNLSNYMNLSPHQPLNLFAKNLDLNYIGQGMGAIGLPGDFSPVSRFVKASFVLSNSIADSDELKSISQFFHMLDSVAMVRGSVITPQNKFDITRYSCCANCSKGIFYYKTYENNQINAIHLHHENLDLSSLISYPLLEHQNVNYLN